MNTEQFWDSVAHKYSDSDMTTHQADFEMTQALSVIRSIPQLQGLTCLGVADGLREPVTFLNELNKNNADSWLTELAINDISGKMLDEAQKNINKHVCSTMLDRLTITRLHYPMQNIVFKPANSKVPVAIIGVYNAHNIENSLKLYFENKDTVGSAFKMSAVYLEGNNLVSKEDYVFDISDYSTYVPNLVQHYDTDNFYGYHVETDKNFVSFYFKESALRSLLSIQWPDCIVKTVSDGKRYIVCTVSQSADYSNCNYLVTSLNNVLGNVGYGNQVACLSKIREIFWQSV